MIVGAWGQVFATGVVQLVIAAYVYGKLANKVDSHEKRIDKHDEKLDDHGERITKLEAQKARIH